MHKIRSLLVASLVLCLTPLSVTAGDFEGILHMSTIHQSTDGTSTMDWYLKGDKARVEMFRGEGLKNVMIVNAQSRTMQMGIPGQKAYMEFSLGGERGEPLADALEKQEVTRTGKTTPVRSGALPIRNPIISKTISVSGRASERQPHFGSIQKR